MYVALDANMRPDLAAYRAAITPNTILLVVSAPQYPHGSPPHLTSTHLTSSHLTSASYHLTHLFVVFVVVQVLWIRWRR